VHQAHTLPMGIKVKKDSCNICARTIRENAKAVFCDLCNNWVHIKCNSISPGRCNQICDEDNDESFFASNALTKNSIVGGQKDVMQHMEASSVKRSSNSPPNISVLNKYLFKYLFNQELPFGFDNDKSFNQTVTLGLNNDNSNLENLNIKISKTEKKAYKFPKQNHFGTSEVYNGPRVVKFISAK
jgi:hypothetical protein